MIRRLFWVGTGTVGLSAGGLLGGTYYLYPDLRNNPQQFITAFTRVLRVIKCGLVMAHIYGYQTSLDLTQQHYKAAKVLKDVLLQNAGLYAKFGQIIASLDVLVPREYQETFSSMFMECPADTYDVVVQEIQDSTGHTIQELFREFDREPISSASIAQVHRAVLKNGQKVAVKVQHPWLRQQAPGDNRVIEIFIDVGERLFPGFKYKWLGEEIRVNLPKELDFKLEVANQLKCKEILKYIPNTYVPYVIPELCNEKIITMEFVDGVSLTKIDQLKKGGYNLSSIARTISESFTHQLYHHGFIHADPHAGNILIRGDKRRPTVVLLDHGLYVDIDGETRYNYARLWKGLIEQNENTIRESCQRLNAGRDYRLFAAMMASKPFEDIMAKDRKSTKQRLGRPESDEDIARIRLSTMERHRDITVLLMEVNRKLLLLFKINEFLRIAYQHIRNHGIQDPQQQYREVSELMYREKRGVIPRMLYGIRSRWTKLKLKLASVIS